MKYFGVPSNTGRTAIRLSCAFVLIAATKPVGAQATPDARQSRDDAWWTGPMMANSAGTLPRGHVLVEPYFYRVSSPHSTTIGSSAYVLYGLTDRFTAGFIPVVGSSRVDGSAQRSAMGVGDFTGLVQYGLTQYHEGSWMPAIGIGAQQSFPTGKYDQLGDKPSDGRGSGAYTTTLTLNTQTYFWMPNGRILRMRANAWQTFSSGANVQDASVYGTAPGFRGRALPGSSINGDVAWEYSLTRNWVLALDLLGASTRSTRVTGSNIQDPTGTQHQTESGSSRMFGFAPAIEYNWTPNVGVLFGTRVITANATTSASITPAIAINFVH
ncbi:MAG: transporter [bacterium]